jgi:N-acyl homoserine lactone hydrolase
MGRIGIPGKINPKDARVREKVLITDTTKGNEVASYTIKPLVLAKYVAEKGYMTFLSGYGSPILRPFIMWCIEGAREKIIVDTAIEAEDYRNYDPKFKGLELIHVMTFEQALESVNMTPDDVDLVIQTHLHFDHCYNTRKCKNAKVIVQKDELDFAGNPAPFEGIYRKELYEGLDIEVIDGDAQIFEGIDIISTPGHSAGGQSVCVQTEKGRAVIPGICSIRENYYPENPHPMAGGGEVILPGIMLDALKTYNSMKKIKQIADIILPLHEPEIINIKSIP